MLDTITKDKIIQDLKNAGIQEGDCILVHSSLSSLGKVENGAIAVVEALIESVGKSGTTVFPAFTFGPDYCPGNPPIFDISGSPCVKSIGVIPETARTFKGGLRSQHPTHSVTAFGKLARWITSGHEYSKGPCGSMTPFDKLASIGGKIVMLGALLQSNTSFHHIEELAGLGYVLQDEAMDITFIGYRGELVTMYETRLHRWGTARDYNKMDKPFIDEGIMKIEKVGNADTRIIDADAQRRYLLKAMFDDPCILLAEEGRAFWQNKTLLS